MDTAQNSNPPATDNSQGTPANPPQEAASTPTPTTYGTPQTPTSPIQGVQNPSPTQPQSIVEPPREAFVQKTGKNFKKVFAMFFIILLVLVLIGASVGAYAIAYNKIKLEKYPEFQKQVSNFVISLPFMPKTPLYLLTKSGYVEQNIKKESFDISLAVDSQDIASALGLSGLDVQAKGAVDYSDPKNVKMNVNAFLTKDFNVEVVKPDSFVYFKFNKVPQIFLTAFGLETTDIAPLLNKWVSYDTTPLDTEARRSITDKEVNPLSEQYVDSEFQKYLDEQVLSKMEVSSTKEDGFDVYQITLIADKDLIDHLGKKLEQESQINSGGSTLNVLGASTSNLSDTVKSLSWKINIDKKDFYIRKITITSDIEVDNVSNESLYLGNSSSVPKNSKAKVAFVAKFGDFGKDIHVTQPETSITSEEFLNEVSDIIQKKYNSLFEAKYNQQTLYPAISPSPLPTELPSETPTPTASPTVTFIPVPLGY